VKGLRVTTRSIGAVLKVLSGSVNQESWLRLSQDGASPPWASTGMEHDTEARQLSEELGSLGKPVRSDPRVFRFLMDEKDNSQCYACVGATAKVDFYNVECRPDGGSLGTAAIQADKLLLLPCRGSSGSRNVKSQNTSVKCREAHHLEIATRRACGPSWRPMEVLTAGIGESHNRLGHL